MTISYRASGTRVQSASAASLSPAKPTVDGANGALLAIVISKNNATHATTAPGWSLIGQVNSGASFTMSVWIAAEGAGNPTFTWSGAVACAARIAYYSDPNNVVDTAIGNSSNNNGLTSTHSTTGFNTTRNNSLAIYIDGAAANTAIATPSGWNEDEDSGSVTDAGRIAYGSKLVATTGTGTGNISVAGANAAWVQFQIELCEQAVTDFQVSKVETSAWIDPLDDFLISKVETSAWIEPIRWRPQIDLIL